MKIALDCRPVFPGMGGIGRFCESLLRQYGTLPHSHHFMAFFTHKRGVKNITCSSNVREIVYNCGMIDDRWDQFFLPTELGKCKADLYHSTCFTSPLMKTCSTVVTVHDVVFRRHPELVADSLRRHLDKGTENSCRTADLILTDSEFSKKEIVELYGIAPGKVTVIYIGVDERFAVLPENDPRLSNTKAKYNLPQKFILYLGALEPKKNPDFLLEGFQEFAKKSEYSDWQLVLAGGQGGAPYDLPKALARFNLTGKAKPLGHIPEEDIVPVLNLASVFVYPSRYEGFGLPPLEAMACGTPVIVCNTSSLPEVVGEAALKVDPNHPSSLAPALEKIINDSFFSAELSQQGLRRAATFTWEKCAKEHLEIYHKFGK